MQDEKIKKLQFTREIVGNIQRQAITPYLATKYSIGTGVIYSMIRDKKILVNGEKINCSYRIKNYDEILIKSKLFFQENAHMEHSNHQFTDRQPQALVGYEDFLKSITIFENDDFIFINKPKEWSTQNGVNCYLNIDDLLRSKLKEHYIIHRLDKDTSGGLLVAKNRKTAQKMGYIIKNREFHKEYFAVIAKTARNNWEITSYIPNQRGNNWEIDPMEREQHLLEEEAPNSKTSFQKIKDMGKYSLIKAFPLTGRKHQVRIHCASMGRAILGDRKYEGNKANRLYLHSYKIQFIMDGKPYKFVCPCGFSKEFVNPKNNKEKKDPSTVE
jgi:23S rRNA pseudouridine955/2504/2580 synthase